MSTAPKLYVVARVPRCPTCGYPGRDVAPRDCADGHWLPLSHRSYKAGVREVIDRLERAASKATVPTTDDDGGAHA